MTQPWQFLGYQKLSARASQVQFTNVWDATSPKNRNMKFKVVMEGMTYNETDVIEVGAPYYYCYTDGTNSSYDRSYYQQYDTNSGSASSKTWSTSAVHGNSASAFQESNQNWILTKGGSGTQRRYSSAEDNLQWGTYEVNWGSQPGIGESMQMKAFNVVSISNSSSGYNHVIAGCGSGGAASPAPGTFYWQAANYTFETGSKFWMWAMRDDNGF